jgi:hypothetical protein
MNNDNIKSVVSVSEMARMVGLSRQRFYQLMGTAFPRPLYHDETKRPYYTEEMQQVCLEVRRRNCGIDGKPILFYSTGYRTREHKSKPRSKQKRPKKKRQHVGIINGLAALGLHANEEQVGKAINRIFPNGTGEKNEGEILREVFLSIKRQDSGDKVER